MKRVLTIQDISCVGKCSLTVALPVISCMGVETAVLPTAVLSSHTAFRHVSKHDLTSDFDGIEQAWLEENLSFDTIYSGYLGSAEQVDMVEKLWERFPGRQGAALHLVDPAMADGGKLYSGFDNGFVAAMKKLCSQADVIVPNMTELFLLTDTPWNSADDSGRPSYAALNHANAVGNSNDPYQAEIRRLMVKLAAQGARTVVLTGYEPAPGKIGALAYDREKDCFYEHVNEKLDCSFHGTGDIFASVLCGALTKGKGLEESIGLAVDFVLQCLKATLVDPEHVWYGVNFEEALPWLARQQ